jgi:hypothetical protein
LDWYRAYANLLATAGLQCPNLRRRPRHKENTLAQRFWSWDDSERGLGVRNFAAMKSIRKTQQER